MPQMTVCIYKKRTATAPNRLLLNVLLTSCAPQGGDQVQNQGLKKWRLDAASSTNWLKRLQLLQAFTGMLLTHSYTVKICHWAQLLTSRSCTRKLLMRPTQCAVVFGAAAAAAAVFADRQLSCLFHLGLSDAAAQPLPCRCCLQDCQLCCPARRNH